MSSFEIRVFIIGDYQVGKNAIVKRFKKLNCTQTEEDNYFIQGDPKSEFGLGKEKSKKALEKFAKYQQLEVSDKSLIRKQIERKILMKFKKIFIVGHSRMEFNFFPIRSADEKIVTGVAENKEDTEEIKFGNKLINLKNVIEEIRKILTKDPKDGNSNLDNLFLFVYDLKDFSTFKKLEIYYNKLRDYFKIDSNYLKAFIGNKVDSRSPLSKREKEYFANFLKNNNGMKMYEISTYNYFNFEKFFEQLFLDILVPIDEELQKPTFLNRFHLILHTRTNLSRAERRIHQVNDVPFLGETDNPDVYAYPEDKAEFRRTFSNMKRGRYGFKIFINKQGPSFPIIDKQGQEKNKQGDLLSKPGTAMGRDKKSKTTIGFGNWEVSNRNKEIREALQTNIPGYSLGIRGGRYGFKNERKKKFQERELELKSAFETHYAGIKKEREKEKKNIDYIENKKEIMKEIVEKIQENENKYLKDREKNKQKQEEMLKDKIEKVKNKQDKYQKIYEKNQREMRKKREEMNHPKTAMNRKGKTPFSKMKDIPNYTLYDITTKHDPNKGWSMGIKYTYNPNKNKDDPDFPKLKSDFDRIVDAPKYAEIKYTAPRFKETKKVPPLDNLKMDDENKYKEIKEKIALIKEKGERATNLKTFLEERRDKREKVLENKHRIEEARKEELEDLKARIPKTGNGNEFGYNNDVVDINYNLVEESSPNYTMKGRYNHGSIFDMPDNYSQVNNDDEDEENKIGSNGKPIQDEEYKKSLPVPQYDVVKPSLPTYSFNKAKRFYSKPLYQPSPNATPVIPFENGIFKPEDKITFSTVQGGMGKARKDTKLKFNGIPGPGQYRIKGFAEKIDEEGRRICKMREKSRKERDLREMEMKIKNGQIANLNNIDKQSKNDKNENNMILKISDNDADGDGDGEDGSNEKQT